MAVLGTKKKQSEAQIELAICQALLRRNLFPVKLKDQSAFREGHYRKGSSFQIRGVADLVVFMPQGRTVWLEVKTPTGTQSKHQKAFQNKLSGLGHEYYVVRSVEDALISILSSQRPS